MQKISYNIQNIDSLALEIPSSGVIFLYGDLGSGKTTLSQSIISHLIGKEKNDISSPTYVYYNRYENIYHFDLYRLEGYEEFINIGGEDIMDNHTGLILVEWPELIETYYTPDMKIRITLGENPEERILEIY